MNLDNEQEIAVMTKEKKVIVVAGAGSGKTRVITERVRHLLDSGVAPFKIVCITFTNLAAQEMKERLSDVDCIGDVFIGTIHSFANTIYKTSGYNYEIMSSEIKLKIFKEILANERMYRNLSYQKYLRYLDCESLAKSGKISEEELEDFLLPSECSDLKQAEEELEIICKERSIITFSELLSKTEEYYHSINGSLEYLLVDEFQDVGTLEAGFISNLNADNIFLVGDDWQSIYGFKGGDVNIFKNLINKSQFTTYLLQNNYRNSDRVVELAKKVIDQVEGKIEKKINVVSEKKGYVKISSRAKLESFLDLIKNEEKFTDWFILVRSNRELVLLEDMLNSKQIPVLSFKRAGLTYDRLNEMLASSAVKLLTVHSAKGLESKNVLLYGNFPLNTPTYMKNEDERKVMYVGITRAKEKLIVLN